MPAEHEAAGSIPARRTTLTVVADFEFSGSACYFKRYFSALPDMAFNRHSGRDSTGSFQTH
jgi:hypothetical protein